MEKKVKKIVDGGMMVLVIRWIIDERPDRLDIICVCFTLTVFFTREKCPSGRGMPRRPIEYWSGFT